MSTSPRMYTPPIVRHQPSDLTMNRICAIYAIVVVCLFLTVGAAFARTHGEGASRASGSGAYHSSHRR